MLHRLCGPPSIPLSFSLAAVLPRRCAQGVSCAAETRGVPTAGTHRLRRGLPGYLILFATHAFAPQRQSRTWRPLSLLVFFPISTNSTSPLGVPPSFSGLESASLEGGSRVGPEDFTLHFADRLRALYAQ